MSGYRLTSAAVASTACTTSGSGGNGFSFEESLNDRRPSRTAGGRPATYGGMPARAARGVGPEAGVRVTPVGYDAPSQRALSLERFRPAPPLRQRIRAGRANASVARVPGVVTPGHAPGDTRVSTCTRLEPAPSGFTDRRGAVARAAGAGRARSARPRCRAGPARSPR